MAWRRARAAAVVLAVIGGANGTAAQANPAGPLPGASANEIRIAVRLTPQASQRLAAIRETVTVTAYFNADPTPRTPQAWRSLEEDTVDLGDPKAELPSTGGLARIPYPARLLQSAGRIRPGSARVTVNVFTSRKAARDNLIHCQFVEGPLSSFAPVRSVTCDLIR